MTSIPTKLNGVVKSLIHTGSVIRNGKGRLRFLHVKNRHSAALHLMLYDKGTSLVLGTDVPFWSMEFAAGEPGWVPMDIWFQVGLTARVSVSDTFSDATVVAANLFTLNYGINPY